MEALSNGSADMIALRPTKVGERSYERADKFLVQRHLQRKELDQRQVDALERAGFIGPLTRQNYLRAVAHRPAGAVGQGFTAAYLVEKGVLDAAEAPAAPKAMRAAGPVAGAAYKGQTIQPVAQGFATAFDVRNPAGELLNAKRFKTQAAAQAFIDGMLESA